MWSSISHLLVSLQLLLNQYKWIRQDCSFKLVIKLFKNIVVNTSSHLLQHLVKQTEIYSSYAHVMQAFKKKIT